MSTPRRIPGVTTAPRPQSDLDRGPNYGRAVLLAGLATVAAVVGGPRAVATIAEAGRQSATQDMLKMSGTHVVEDFNDGKLKGLDVVRVTPKNGDQSAFAAASVITKEGEDILETQDRIIDQTGEHVEGGVPLILKRELVDPKVIDKNQNTGPAGEPGSLPDLPNDRQIHVK